ncbi:MAG: hypothetical protein IKI20_04600 [Lachnospiraceae bacterium]|nr:hypothetical protein [Lachnospiraceae bacterium]
MIIVKKIFAGLVNIIVIFSFVICLAGCNHSEIEKTENQTEMITSELVTND